MTSDKVAVVTGSNKGLGFALVKGLCEEFKGVVYLTSRDKDRGRKACEELKNIGLNPVFHLLDVTDPNSVQVFCDYISDRHGKIDILINNAGVLFLKTASEPKLEQVKTTIDVNFFALVSFTEAILPLMKENSVIVNISSSSGHLSRIPSVELRKAISSVDLSLQGLRDLVNSYVEAVKENRECEEGWGDSPYVVSKVAVNAYTFTLHRKLSPRGIKVNCVHPGYVISDMTGGSGNVSPQDASKVVLSLALAAPGSGLYVWHDGTQVPWDGPDPRGYIDGKV